MSSFSSEKYGQELKKHRQFISKFKVFPDKTRKIIYASLMQLPLNHSHFLELTKPFKQLPEHTTNRQTAFIVNALMKLYPSLGNQWLPGLIYPFVKLFQEDSIMCFESSLTFLLNWYQPVYQNYPNPSKKVIDFARSILVKLDKKINTLNYTLSAILNPMILVCLTDVLNKQDSLRLLDFLVTHPYEPEYFLCTAVSIVLLIQEQLCKLNSAQQISIALRRQKKLNVDSIISAALNLAEENRKQLQSIYSKNVFPLTKQRYPVFEFIKSQFIKSNKAIQKIKYDQMNNLSLKYAQLSGLINNKLKEGLVANQSDITDRYQQVQGQTIQYLNRMKRQHQMKLKALRQIEQKFKSQIAYQQQGSKHSMNQRNLKVIERRGRLQKEVLKLEKQAMKIRQLEQDLVDRMSKIAEIRKQQILDQNRRLEEEQRSQQMYGFYS